MPNMTDEAWLKVKETLIDAHPDFFESVSKLKVRTSELGEPDVTELDILVAILSGGLWAMEHEINK
jgi:hypothetical protein